MLRCTVLVYISCFNLNRLSTILQTLEEKQQRHGEDFWYDWHDEEKHKNIVTFLKWILGHVQEAEVMAAREVHERPNNILALSNSAYVLWQKGTVDEAWERLTTLETLRAGDPQEYDGLDSDGRPLECSCILTYILYLLKAQRSVLL